ncbi:hypothetical protein [Shewanella sp. NIFS-20-20]|uniref:hypothetical protein n=1 Tax=Shewanella sp. NIFS-20-20 TaxID=2853806 RepID=UPI001C439A84|nr:hypothetical protein [Shewanella sp. NIFS-20-20]MBV7317517.1 hypothetical protein [Shewanella sp. NIFS-20-20]
MKNIRLASVTLLGMLFLQACGGSNDAADTPTEPPSPNLARCDAPTGLTTVIDDDTYRVLTEANYFLNQNQQIIVQPKVSSAQWRFLWRQLRGPNVEMISPTSPVLSFEASQAGEYSFEIAITTANSTVNEQVSITIANPSQALTARIDHQAVEGNNVSFRLDSANAASAISWCIQSGPDLQVDVSQPNRPLFTAPQVDNDTLSVLQVTANINGVSHSDQAFLLTTNQAAINSPYFDEPLARVHAYRSSSMQAALERCIYSNQLTSPCRISELPLIGQTDNSDNIDAILDRVLVSHPWMGDNFDSFLRQMDPNSDFIRLLQSVSAIVISYDVRPSFYWVLTGAIYLDPSDLWLTPSQRDTINEAPDYRSGFGNDLQFLVPWRYVKNNQYANSVIGRDVRRSRTLDELRADLASLLYHELAHANDFFPRSVHQQLVGDTFVDAYNSRNNAKQLVSDLLTQGYPLQSDVMSGLAQVRFMGASANSTQRQYLPADISSFFSQDSANDFYNYSTIREDAAMLFEESMMSYRLNVIRDVAVTDKPETITADSIIVDWGQRGRIGDDALASRAAFVIEAILPEENGINLINSLPEPILMNSGQSWAANLGISQQQNRSVQQAASPLLPAVNLEGRHAGRRPQQ